MINLSNITKTYDATPAVRALTLVIEDGWPGLRARYRLPQENVFGMEHDLAYRSLAAGAIDATDAEIASYDLCVLADDLGYFPIYTAVLLYRGDLEKRAPQAVGALARLEGTISEAAMIRMNERAKIERAPSRRQAAPREMPHRSPFPAETVVFSCHSAAI